MEDSSKFESFVDGYRYDFGTTHERIDGVEERLLDTEVLIDKADGRLDSHARLIRNINRMVGDLDAGLRELRNEVERTHANSVQRDHDIRKTLFARVEDLTYRLEELEGENVTAPAELEAQRPFVVVPGTFDTAGARDLHEGHINLLKKASRLGRVRVSLGHQRWAEERKGHPVASYQSRAEALMRTGLVWEVDRRERDDTMSLGSILIKDDYVWEPLPSAIVAGSDWTPDLFLEHHGLTWEDMERLEIGVVIFPRTPGVSSSELHNVS